MRRAAELKAQGADIIDLSAGQPDGPSPKVAIDEAKRALDDGYTRYTVSSGMPDLRQALAERYARDFGAPWELPDVVITVGAKAALFQLMQTVLDNGDSAVLPTPSWVSFSEQMRFAGGRPIHVPMDAADGFALHAEPLIEAMDDATRLVLINSPCNPTGGRMTAPELERLALACAERDVLLVSDETYEHFVYDGEPVSAAGLATRFPETVVVIGSFSKSYSMTGWRVGWVIGPRPLMEKIDALQSHLTSNVTSFAMRGALAALRYGEEDVTRLLETFRRRRRLAVEALNGLPGFRCPSPAGAFYAFPEISDCFFEGRHGSVAWAEFFLEEAGVAVVPGTAFGEDRHLRFSFACRDEALAQAFSRIQRILGI